MATDRQIFANRRNARSSTGPRTAKGKSRSRRNAYRHGLTAETVVSSFEQPEKYRWFEAKVRRDYDPQTAIEHELINRLASLMWRLRRATLIETGLFELQGDLEQNRVQSTSPALTIFYDLLNSPKISASNGSIPAERRSTRQDATTNSSNGEISEPRFELDMASVYLEMCRTSPKAMKRLTRYEIALWRQVSQTLSRLDLVISQRVGSFRRRLYQT